MKKEILAEDIDFYVAPHGSDLINTGLSDSPWYSRGRVLEYLEKFDVAEHVVTIHVAPGLYEVDTNNIAEALLLETPWKASTI